MGHDFGVLVPPFALHLPAPELLAACWAMMREPTWGSRVTRAKKEAVAAAVSTTNQCPYCVDVHTAMLHTLGDRAPAAAIAAADPDTIADAGMRALVAWACASRTPDAPILRERPFPDAHAPELVGIAVAYHYLNRMVNIFVAESPFPMATARTRPYLRRLAAPAFRRLLARRVEPGASLDLLRPAPLPPDLGWAAGEPTIAAAFGAAAAAFEAAGQRVLPAPVRTQVTDRRLGRCDTLDGMGRRKGAEYKGEMTPQLKGWDCPDLDPTRLGPDDDEVCFGMTLHIGTPDHPRGGSLSGACRHPGGLHTDLGQRRSRRCPPIVVNPYRWEAVLAEIERRLSDCRGLTWDRINDCLRQQFAWEYEGMA